MTSHDNVTDIVGRLRNFALNTLALIPDKLQQYPKTDPDLIIKGFSHQCDLLTEAADTIATLRKQLENAREALEPSAATKYCYSGEFKQNITLRDEDGEEYSYPVTIEWTTIKEIMAAINARALEGQPC